MEGNQKLRYMGMVIIIPIESLNEANKLHSERALHATRLEISFFIFSLKLLKWTVRTLEMTAIPFGKFYALMTGKFKRLLRAIGE